MEVEDTKPLFYLEAKDGRGVRIVLWVGKGIPCFSYKEHEESPFIPSGRQPNYGRGNGIVVDVVKPSPTGINAQTATEY
ncbi:MAG: hypothetical protein QXR26_08910 [Candidatus Caldarchaeum sp.]